MVCGQLRMRHFRLFSQLNLLLLLCFCVFDLALSGNIRPTRTHFWVEDPSRGRSFTSAVSHHSVRGLSFSFHIDTPGLTSSISLTLT
ncbi:hypothetical protein ARMGADRAFT_117071 [Armillaria gallica]|uniref:Secreted protein n=1 Tax=Armillaria gallica TaxID=47427 RepID=A0A2H3DTF6_ARMGA|nr:hypothetical protein ARMGADRAFT_117071 [Armillaria gallica]